MSVEPHPIESRRLLSLDVFRGMTMFLLVAEGTHLYHHLKDALPETSFFYSVVQQFHHHPWNGLRFWDLIQPYFMFIVGVAMVWSLNKRWDRGDSWQDTFRYILIRCFILLLLGVGLHCGYSGHLVWELWNVLSQLSFTILVAFLIFRLPPRVQFLITILLLVVTELFYRLWPVTGFNEAFVQGKNFGAWMDLRLMGKINRGGWVAINALPTAAHTIWGVLAGTILRSSRRDYKKIRILAIWGLIALAVGYGLDWSGLTPIIKRICTTSFVIVSGGWCLLTLTFLFWLVDCSGIKKWTAFFIIVGMNPIFIYLFSQTVGSQWFNEFIHIFTGGIFAWIRIPESFSHILSALCVLTLEWGVCYWLYKRKIFIRI